MREALNLPAYRGQAAADKREVITRRAVAAPRPPGGPLREPTPQHSGPTGSDPFGPEG
ncbi:hypothetical protein OG883_22655 [Streptomyces sp. NBC_01142]|uniref:hypothetical protein n=1 Tax=Streptomyces sp. NBC_01142 TaxID=2975865 RepID=UPI00224D4722|nr:hypothetical protein [Streptomyces sp. NBC_01142]MCX4822647.1 hypothetical protein [Streptomyces sp. NBC_01142]